MTTAEVTALAKYGAEYQRNRKIILEGNPDCALCGGAGADTADHILPLMAGGDDSLDNLQPAHARCNYRRGQRDQARATAVRRANRPESLFSSPLPTDRKSVV